MFQSTHSLRSATGALRIFLHPHLVSIHALLAECDLVPCQLRMHVRGFNPRTPCGVRPAQAHGTRSTKSFNPRTPCGVRPLFVAFPPKKRGFQSTHSLRSATPLHHRKSHCSCRFNPRTPCGVRRLSWTFPRMTLKFQSTHSLRSATGIEGDSTTLEDVSIHALLAECDMQVI